MLNLAAVRGVLADWVEDHKPDGLVAVYRRGVLDGAWQAPAVSIGQPSMEEADVQPCGLSRWEWPVHVVVDRPGTDEEATQAELEQLWPQVYTALEQLLSTDPYLGAADIANAQLVRADFGSLTVRGQSFPAYEITLEILG